MRVWLHEVTGNETGWIAWCLDVHGFATWAITETEVLGRVPGNLVEHKARLARHGIESPDVGGGIDIVERVRGGR